MAALILGVLLVLALVFGVWAFSSRQSIKTDANAKLAQADKKLAQAQAAQASADAANKTPYRSYTGPSTYGSVSFKYPKSWNAYIDQTSDTQPVEGYFYPGIVPGIQSDTAFALRIELVDNTYDSVVSQFQSDLQDGSVKASAFLPAKMKKVTGAQVGLRLTGAIAQNDDGTNLNGSMVILKVRDKTLQIYTESNNYLDDLNNIVLASLTFQP